MVNILFIISIYLLLGTLVYLFLNYKNWKLMLITSVFSLFFSLSMSLFLLLIKSDVAFYTYVGLYTVGGIVLETLLISKIFKVEMMKSITFAFLANFLPLVLFIALRILNLNDNTKMIIVYSCLGTYILLQLFSMICYFRFILQNKVKELE